MAKKEEIQAYTLLLLTNMLAFHKKCMGCHQKLERGPYTKADCGKCHTK